MRCLSGRGRQLNNSKARYGVAAVHERPHRDCATCGTRFCRRRGVGTTLGLLLQMPANRTTISPLKFLSDFKEKDHGVRPWRFVRSCSGALTSARSRRGSHRYNEAYNSKS